MNEVKKHELWREIVLLLENAEDEGDLSRAEIIEQLNQARESFAPRCSAKTFKAIDAELITFEELRGLWFKVDEKGNIIVR